MIPAFLQPYTTMIAIGAVVAALLGAFWFGHHVAASSWEAKYNKREAQIEQQIAAEVSRVSRANAMAKAHEAARLKELEADKTKLETRIKELSDAADTDPDRNNACLSSDSRLRIDSVR